MVRVISWPLTKFQSTLRSGYETTPEVLAVVRILFCAHILVFGLIPIAWLGDLPNLFFRPPLGPVQLFNAFPSRTLGEFLDIAGIVLVVMVGVGLWTRASSILLFGWAVTTSAFLFSLGKVDHSLIWWTLVPLFGIAGWGDSLSVDRLWRGERPTASRPNWPLPVLAFIVAFGYLTAALPKLGRGWLSLESQAAESYMKDLFVSQGRDELLAERFALLEAPVLWELLDWWTVAFELGVALTVLWPPLFRRLLLLASIFHMAVILVMNISFAPMMFAYIPLVASGGVSRFSAVNNKVLIPVVSAVFVALGGVALWSRSPVDVLVTSVSLSKLSFQALAAGLLVLFVGFTYRETRLEKCVMATKNIPDASVAAEASAVSRGSPATPLTAVPPRPEMDVRPPASPARTGTG